MERYTAAGFDAWEREQKRKNWQLAVDVANQWRRTLGVPEVSYPYPSTLR